MHSEPARADAICGGHWRYDLANLAKAKGKAAMLNAAAYRIAAFFGDPALWGACPPDLLRYFTFIANLTS
jgi:hypothetical protein